MFLPGSWRPEEPRVTSINITSLGLSYLGPSRNLTLSRVHVRASLLLGYLYFVFLNKRCGVGGSAVSDGVPALRRFWILTFVLAWIFQNCSSAFRSHLPDRQIPRAQMALSARLPYPHSVLSQILAW